MNQYKPNHSETAAIKRNANLLGAAHRFLHLAVESGWSRDFTSKALKLADDLITADLKNNPVNKKHPEQLSCDTSTVCPRCGFDKHKANANYCGICGLKLFDKEESVT
ncbi:hypothetical protein KP77_25340 [Jeotgalibacillus alimentarius]|uniref:Uncharacterized protein n=1 Tax=Jeotgalibacillus alimentarius TaxID=135826 RepID=A0A0C2R9G2_9BACL|nr:hypothetical protein [Jeotgalibacillus alimentarius]KIL46965.1 hypothetical protein KP77_25340 [Jeotgalibacillus alimentarius]